ncbi:ABC transporter permease protein, probable glycolipid exporter [Crocosphaera subtropica ATCC 51142]|uniref:ABC transporter permease protein, probable glycolipid exporter n=2 Tax=Crocosphaera TaxID=263510 RepID=B1WQ77_CROS5|nr:ABC transporter permease protein, probable glycolipid exporter [Crocosphaera subtropica ATCC 51142]
MFMQLGFEGALYESNTRLHSSLDADLVMLNRRSKSLAYSYVFSRRRLYQALAFEQVEGVSEFYVEYGIWKNDQTNEYRPIFVFGFDPDKPTFTLPEVNQHLEDLKKPDRILFDRQAKPDYGPIAANYLKNKTSINELNDRQVETVGLFTLGPSFAADGNIITSDTNFQQVFKLFRHHRIGFINLGLIRLKPGVNPQMVKNNLKAYLPQDVTILTKQEFINFEKTYWRTTTPIGFMFRLGTTVGFIVGIVIVYQIIQTDVNDHLPQYATLKAIGYTNNYLLGVVFHETIMLALLGYVPGVGISFALYQLSKAATLLPMRLTVTRMITVFFLTVVMCCVSGAIAIRKLKDADPADIF